MPVRVFVVGAACLLGILRPVSSQVSSPPRARLLIPGDHQTRARPELGPDTWFGLYRDSAQGYHLRQTTVLIENTTRGCGDQGRRIVVSDSSRPLFLVSGLRSLRQGAVDSVFEGKKFVYPAESVPLRFGEQGWYSLTAFGTATWRPSEVWVDNYQLVLQRARSRQVLALFPRVDWDGPPQLLWAGDLDHDQALDLLLDLRRSYVGNVYVLFLSSLAATDSLVGRAAEFSTAGC